MKKLPPVKKYSEEEQWQRRQEDHAAIVGKTRICMDCNIKLTKETRSFYQPEIRCLNCFEIFADGVKETLENLVKELEPNKK